MLTRSYLLLLLFVVENVFSRKTPPVLGTLCDRENRFLHLLRHTSVSIVNSPIWINTTCGFEFDVYGSCCKESGLLQFSKTQTEKLMLNVEFINREYHRFQGVLTKVYDFLQRIAMAPPTSKKEQWNRMITRAKEKLDDPEVREYFETHAGSAADAHRFVRENTKCWEMQAKARQVTLCYTCSGRSSHFFKDNKALISQETCVAFVRDCGYSLAALVKFILSFEKLPVIAKDLKSLGIDLNFMQKMKTGKIDKYFEEFRAQKINEIIETARNLHTPAAQAEMCSKFLRLGEEPIISQMRHLFASNSSWVVQAKEMGDYIQMMETQINANLKNYKKRDQQDEKRSQQNHSNWSLSRLLQFNGIKPETLLNSDSKILDVNDPSYSSVGVSGHSPMQFGHQFP